MLSLHEFDLLSWFAGILDGEGCICIGKVVDRNHKSGYAYHMHLSVGNSKEVMIDFLLKKFGGSVYYKAPSGGRRRDFWTWSISGSDAEELLRAVRNLSICKQEEIDIALKFRATIGQQGMNQYTSDVVNVTEIREECYLKMKELHNRDRVVPKG